MAKYVIEFAKTGTICYTSHLDVMRMFKRIFKRADIKLAYSQGFNPHPKMGFAQPLSLGYEALEEYIEFETQEDMDPDVILDRLQAIMPEGIELKYCRHLDHVRKTLSALTEAAEYVVKIPLEASAAEALPEPGEMVRSYMDQDRIVTLKKQKKKKELKEVDIKPMIRDLRAFLEGDHLILAMLLDQGSASNLSPELVISTFIPFAGLNCDRSDIGVTRLRIVFVEDPVGERNE